MAPRLAVSSTVGAIPCGGTSPLASEITGVRRSSPRSERPAMTSAERDRGHAEEDVVGAAEAVVGGLDAQLARERDAGQVVAVLAVGLEPLALLARARLQRGAEAAAGEQHRDRGPERSGAHDDGSPRARGGQREMGAGRHP